MSKFDIPEGKFCKECLAGQTHYDEENEFDNGELHCNLFGTLTRNYMAAERTKECKKAYPFGGEIIIQARR